MSPYVIFHTISLSNLSFPSSCSDADHNRYFIFLINRSQFVLLCFKFTNSFRQTSGWLFIIYLFRLFLLLHFCSLFTPIISQLKQSTRLHCHRIGSNPIGLISHDHNHNYIYFPSTRAYNWGTLTLENLSSEKSIV